MQPVLKEYVNDEQLQTDIRKLMNNGFYKKDIYVLAHDDDRTKRIAESAGGVNTIGFEEMKIGEAIGTLFEKKGDELRTKLQEISFSESQSEVLEADLDKGKVFLIVLTNENIDQYLI